MNSEDDEILQAFLLESSEGLDELDRDLVELEQAPNSREILSRIFRTIHTIKGASGFLALGRLERLSHDGENVLARLRDGDIELTAPIADALLGMVDTIRALLEAVRVSGTDDTVDIDAMIELLAIATAGGDAEPADVQADAGSSARDEPHPEPPSFEPVHEADSDVANDVITPDPEPAVVPSAPAPSGSVRTPGPKTETVRVDVELLDTLVGLVGELVLTRNQIVQHADAQLDQELGRASQRLNLVVSELQEGIMRTRMQPIGQAWTKFPRVVRDLGAQLAKNVQLEMTGQETELDRSLLEAVKDPLTHLVRNSIDHGIETPEERLAAGKPKHGTLALRAYHESGQVVVEIADDGKGLDPKRIGDVAVERGVVSREQLARMPDREINELIFRAGFSTAAAVTNVSGRGVGMDVVRTNIEGIGGVVDLSSRLGFGTTVRVRIPLTLAIIPALIVGEAGERFSIPQTNLVELVRLEPAEIAKTIETVAGVDILRLRGQLLPLVSLSGQLGLTPKPTDAITIVVVQADEIRFGLVVEEVHDTQEIVVKPLGRQLKAIPMYAGATIMGDGRVALILDVGGLARAAGVGESAQRRVERDQVTTSSTSLLVLDLGDDRRAALPLAEVSRLEEFPADQFERSGDVEVMQYRGGILPLVRLSESIGLSAAQHDADTVSVVVHEEDDVRVGIVANSVIDVVETAVDPTSVGRRPGVLGTVIVLDKVTDLIDLAAVVATTGGYR